MNENTKEQAPSTPIDGKGKQETESPASDQANSERALTTPERATAPREDMERVREIILGSQGGGRKPEVDHLREIVGTQILREIIFGTHIEEYERRFSDLRRDQEQVLSDLKLVQDSLNEFGKTQAKRFETLEREVRRADDELRREVNRLRNQETQIQQLLNQTRQQEALGKSLSDSTNELREAQTRQERNLGALETTVQEQREQHERDLEGLKSELRQSESDLRAELRRIADRLGDQKTDRKDLAAMLMDIAARLESGGGAASLLGGMPTSSKR